MTETPEVTSAPGPARFSALPRNVILLGVVSFFADISGEMTYPLVPIFLTTVLGAPVAAVGLIEGVAESTASLLKLVSGWWSDRVGRRLPLVAGGYGLAVCGKLLLAVATAWPLVLLARFVDRFGKGVRSSPRDALIADSTPAELRGRAFGLHRSMDTAGAVIGPLLGLGLVALFHDQLRLVFLVAVVPGVLSVLALARVSEASRTVSTAAAVPPTSWHGAMERPLLLFLAVTLIFALGNSSDAFLILRARDLGLSTTAAVLAYVVYNFVYMGVAAPAGALSDRIDRRMIFAVGLMLFALVYAGLAFANQVTYVWPLFAVYGVYIALTDGIGKALIVDLAPADRRGAALGLYGMLTGLGALVASLAAGVLWDQVSAGAPFILGAISALSAAVLLLLVRPARDPVAAA